MAKIYGDRWQVERPLSGGGQAETFVVKDRSDLEGAPCVLKRLRNVSRLERFRKEVEAIQKLSHQNVIHLIDADLTGEKPYLVMEYCEGGSLADHPSEWSHNPVATLDLFAQVCDGLAHAHAQDPPIVHRDVKPANILLRSHNGPPVVADFGICYIEDGERLTLTDEAVGARRFTAPELADGRSDMVKTWSDVYSLGKLLYWMLAGGRVFDREQHRDPRYNLAGEQNEQPEYEHVNRLLDKMICADPRQRLLHAGRAANGARYMAELLRRGARAIGPDLPQRCDFCKQGNYRHVVHGGVTDVRNFGITPVGNPSWQILVCETCGHVQLFRADYAETACWQTTPATP